MPQSVSFIVVCDTLLYLSCEQSNLHQLEILVPIEHRMVRRNQEAEAMILTLNNPVSHQFPRKLLALSAKYSVLCPKDFALKLSRGL